RAQMAEKVAVGATSLFESIREDRESVALQFAARQGALFVSRQSECNHAGRLPCGIEGRGPERITEDVADQVRRKRDAPFGRVAAEAVDAVAQQVGVEPAAIVREAR